MEPGSYFDAPSRNLCSDVAAAPVLVGATRGRNGERYRGTEWAGSGGKGRGGGALGVMPSEGCNGPDDELLVPSEPPGSCRHAQLHVFTDSVWEVQGRAERRFILARGLIFGSVLPTMSGTVREEGGL